MPGRSGTVLCPSCNESHDFTVGGSIDFDNVDENGAAKEIVFTQYVCLTCKTIRSSTDEKHSQCEECGDPMYEWEGKIGAHMLHGPCPNCKEVLTEANEDGPSMEWDD